MSLHGQFCKNPACQERHQTLFELALGIANSECRLSSSRLAGILVPQHLASNGCKALKPKTSPRFSLHELCGLCPSVREGPGGPAYRSFKIPQHPLFAQESFHRRCEQRPLQSANQCADQHLSRLIIRRYHSCMSDCPKVVEPHVSYGLQEPVMLAAADPRLGSLSHSHCAARSLF